MIKEKHLKDVCNINWLSDRIPKEDSLFHAYPRMKWGVESLCKKSELSADFLNDDVPGTRSKLCKECMFRLFKLNPVGDFEPLSHQTNKDYK